MKHKLIFKEHRSFTNVSKRVGWDEDDYWQGLTFLGYL
jgi:hypothetical protein